MYFLNSFKVDINLDCFINFAVVFFIYNHALMYEYMLAQPNILVHIKKLKWVKTIKLV